MSRHSVSNKKLINNIKNRLICEITSKIKEDIKISRKNNWLKITYYFATIIIAGVAIISLWYNIDSGHKTTVALQKVKEGFEAYAEPLVIFEKIEWVFDKKNPPVKVPMGIRIVYKNASNVPLQIYNSEFKLFFGKHKMDAQSGKTENKSAILEPGKEIGIVTYNKKEFYEHLPKMSIDLSSEPILLLYLMVDFSRLNDTKKLRYSVKVDIAQVFPQVFLNKGEETVVSLNN